MILLVGAYKTQKIPQECTRVERPYGRIGFVSYANITMASAQITCDRWGNIRLNMSCVIRDNRTPQSSENICVWSNIGNARFNK